MRQIETSFPEVWNHHKIKRYNLYVILKLFLNKNLLYGYHRRKLKAFWSNLRLVLQTREFVGVISSTVSQDKRQQLFDKKITENCCFFHKTWKS